jgi:hypothetical protein
MIGKDSWKSMKTAGKTVEIEENGKCLQEI